MKDKEKVVRLLNKISYELWSKDEHQVLINFATELNLIYGQAIQIDITDKDLKFNGITFGERGIGVIVARALSSN